jgi:hypothetical protein
MCQVEASPYLDLFGEEAVTVKISCAPLNSRQCVKVGEFGYDKGSIAANLQEVSTEIGKLDMDVIQHEMDDLCDRVRAEGTGEVKTELLINDRKCEVVAHRGGLFGKNVKVEIFYTPLGSSERQPVRKFIHRKERPISKHIAEISAEVAEIDRKSDRRSRVAAIVTPIVNFTHRTVSRREINSRMGEISSALGDVEKFMRQNDLSQDEILALKAVLTQLGGNTKMIQRTPFPPRSINECDNIPACRTVAQQIEKSQVWLDAKINGQSGLEKMSFLPAIVLGSGNCGTACLIHRDQNGQEPIVVKIFNSGDEGGIANAALSQGITGVASGNYRCNLATSKLQGMVTEVGRSIGVEVPHVIAEVSAAEANGKACIAMEYLEGQTIGSVIDEEERTGRDILIYDNEFIRRETWLQLMDILTGQMDRHGDNVMYVGNLPVGIDHDLSFPTKPPRNFADSIPDQLVKFDGQREYAIDGVSLRNYGMPPFIDSEMRNVIRALDLKELEAMYGECGLTRPQLSAAMSRARGLKARVEALEQSPTKMIIEPDAWASYSPGLNVDNSYAARHATGR